MKTKKNELKGSLLRFTVKKKKKYFAVFILLAWCSTAGASGAKGSGTDQASRLQPTNGQSDRDSIDCTQRHAERGISFLLFAHWGVARMSLSEPHFWFLFF